MFSGAVPCFMHIQNICLHRRPSVAGSQRRPLDIYLLLTPEGVPSGLPKGMGMLTAIAYLLVTETMGLRGFQGAAMRLVFVGAEEWEGEWLDTAFTSSALDGVQLRFDIAEDEEVLGADVQTRFKWWLGAMVRAYECIPCTPHPLGHLNLPAVAGRLDTVSFVTRDDFKTQFEKHAPLLLSSYDPESVRLSTPAQRPSGNGRPSWAAPESMEGTPTPRGCRVGPVGPWGAGRRDIREAPLHPAPGRSRGATQLWTPSVWDNARALDGERGVGLLTPVTPQTLSFAAAEAEHAFRERAKEKVPEREKAKEALAAAEGRAMRWPGENVSC
jgi:hypothetical protein